jgi:hypothetical protein
MSLWMSQSDPFFLEDSSSLDDLDIEDLLQDDDIEHMVRTIVVKNFRDRLRVKRQHGSMLDRLCI